MLDILPDDVLDIIYQKKYDLEYRKVLSLWQLVRSRYLLRKALRKLHHRLINMKILRYRFYKPSDVKRQERNLLNKIKQIKQIN